MKTLTTLLNTPIGAGAEATVITEAGKFPQKYISPAYIADPWWGTIPLIVEPYVEATYDAYTAAAPPAWDHIMFDSDRSHFKCGSGIWWGVLQAYVLFVGQ